MAVAAPAPREMPRPPKTHWDTYYHQHAMPEVAEYMLPFDRIEAFFDPEYLKIVPDSSRFLVVGCGISALGEDLHDRFNGRIAEIMNVDINSSCVEHLRRRNVHRPRMCFAVNDMTKSQLPSNGYDVVVDKGVLDDVLAFTRCVDDAVDDNLTASRVPPDAGERAACSMVWEVSRVLTSPRGVYIIVSIHGRDRLGPLLTSDVLEFDSVEHFSIGRDGVEHHVHVCRRTKSMEMNDHRGIPNFEKYVADVIQRKYTETMPWLTAERKRAITAIFTDYGPKGCQSDYSVRRLPASLLHAEVFNEVEKNEYTQGDFLDDLREFLCNQESVKCEDSDPSCDGPNYPTESICEEVMLTCDTFMQFLTATQ